MVHNTVPYLGRGRRSARSNYIICRLLEDEENDDDEEDDDEGDEEGMGRVWGGHGEQEEGVNPASAGIFTQ